MAFPVFDTQDAVPEPMRQLYEERDGKWHVKASELPDVTTLETTLRKERDERKKADDLAKAEKKRADDLQRAKDASDKGISAEELQKIRDAEAAARKPIEDELAKTKAENRNLKLTDRVRLMALEKGVMKTRIVKVMKDLADRVDLADDGTTIVVKDLNGSVTSETIEDFLSKTYKAEAPFFYDGPGGSGSGAEATNGNGGGDRPAPKVVTTSRHDIAGTF